MLGPRLYVTLRHRVNNRCGSQKLPQDDVEVPSLVLSHCRFAVPSRYFLSLGSGFGGLLLPRVTLSHQVNRVERWRFYRPAHFPADLEAEDGDIGCFRIFIDGEASSVALVKLIMYGIGIVISHNVHRLPPFDWFVALLEETGNVRAVTYDKQTQRRK